MSEFEQAIGEISNYLKESKEGFTKGWEGFKGAEAAYKRIERLREEMLQNILKERGLAICSAHHTVGKDETASSPEQLGIYPKDQMKLHYFRSTLIERQGEYYDSTTRIVAVRLLCPKHYPVKPNYITGPVNDPEVSSAVIQENGRFILEVSRKDITALIEKDGWDIEPEGEKHPMIEVFRYFGIPDLPEKPDLDSVRHNF